MTALLLDQGLAPSAAAALRERGFDVVHVHEIGLSQAEDIDVLTLARNENRICVTLDHDFHAHLALAGEGSPSVILLRIEGLPAAAQAALIESVCVSCAVALAQGAAVSTDGCGMRVRRLPLR
jgi:predicted nuclease of predicted toxin-antitoxin system